MQTALVLLKTFSWNKTRARDKVMLGRGRAHGLTILKRIYKNYKEKSSLCLLISLKKNVPLPAQKKSDEFSSQRGLN